MDKERLIYDLFTDKLINLLKSDEITDNQLRVILKFLEDNNISANPSKNEKVRELAEELELDIPFDTDEVPLERAYDSN